MDKLSDKALKLILDFEGINTPGQWPGGDSGITVGYGYDLGYVTVDQFESDWHDLLSDDIRIRLKPVVGLHGIKARNRAPDLDDIRIRKADALKVLVDRTIPLTQFRTEQAFPGVAVLPADVQGALVSLVYNRGTSMVDPPGSDRRSEMRAIRDAVASQDLQEIANQLRSMKRLWEGKGMTGLIRRREAEAVLVESAIA